MRHRHDVRTVSGGRMVDRIAPPALAALALVTGSRWVDALGSRVLPLLHDMLAARVAVGRATNHHSTSIAAARRDRAARDNRDLSVACSLPASLHRSSQLKTLSGDPGVVGWVGFRTDLGRRRVALSGA